MSEIDKIKDLVGGSQNILIIQADNPDADSLASALALETILEDMGKATQMYCGVDMPGYLKYLSGWDRVSTTIEPNFDISIIVDTSAVSLLERVSLTPEFSRVIKKSTIVLDHHDGVICDINYADVVINDSTKVSTGELIFEISAELRWMVSVAAGEFVMTSILADSMGLTTSNTTSDTYITMSNLLKLGVNRTQLEEKRREYNKMPEIIYRYKAKLMERTEIVEDSLAIVAIPQDEINEYSPLYNPGPLVQPEHLQTEGIKISIVLKYYDSGRITGTIRCNYGFPIASELAKNFGGGGHDYAAGFKIENAKLDNIKLECIKKVRELLQNSGQNHETI